MKKTSLLFLILITALSFSQIGMGRHGDYDEEARTLEKLERQHGDQGSSMEKGAVQNVASGVRDVATAPAQFIGDTAASASDGPITGTLNGARDASGKLLDSTLKGAYKVATLGQGELEHYEVEDPEPGSGDTTKIKLFKF